MEATAKRGAGEVLLTSMDRDGTGEGYDVELLRGISDEVHVPLGQRGAGHLGHFAEALVDGHADAVLAASRAALRSAHDPGDQGIPARLRRRGAAVSDAPSPDRSPVELDELRWDDRGPDPGGRA